MKHFRLPVLLILAIILAVSCAPDPAFASSSPCWGLPPICPLSQHAICLCPSTSRFSCRWECVTLP